MQYIDAELDRFEIIKRRQAVVAVGVELHRHIAGIVEKKPRQGAGALGS